MTMYSPDQSRTGNFIRATALTVGLALGATACTAESPASHDSTSASAEATPSSTAPEIPVDIYTGQNVEVVAQPLVSGPVGEDKAKAFMSLYEMGTVYISESTPEDVETARAEIAGLSFEHIKDYAFKAVNAKVAVAIGNQEYYPTSDTQYGIDTMRASIGENKGALELISDEATRTAASKALDYRLADGAVNATDAYGAKLPGQYDLLVSNITDTTLLPTIALAAAGDKAAKEQLKTETDAVLEQLDAIESASADPIFQGSAARADLINDSLNTYAKAREGLSEAGPLLKDVGLDIRDGLWVGLGTEEAASIVSVARTRAQNIPDAIVAAQTQNAIDSRLAEWLSNEDSQLATSSYSYHKEDVTKLLAHDTALLNLLQPGELRDAVSAYLDYTRGEHAIETTDTEFASQLIGSIQSEALKQQVQQVNGGDLNARNAFDRASAGASYTLEEKRRDAHMTLYYGSNSYAESINQDIAAFNRAVEQDGR